MIKYPNITHILKTVFVVDFGFSESMAVSLYKESIVTSGKEDDIKKELKEALSDQNISWKNMLLNDEYEVLDAETEEEAKDFILRMLWEPLNGVATSGIKPYK